MLLEDRVITKYPILSELRNFVLDYTSNPPRLQDLCRTLIRNELRDSPCRYCKELPVPQRLKDFITFESL